MRSIGLGIDAQPFTRIILGAFLVSAFAVGLYLFARSPGDTWLSATSGISIMVAAAALGLVYLLGLHRRFGIRSIRARVLAGFVSMAVISALGISLGSVVVGYVNGRQQALDRLESVVALKELEIQVGFDALQGELLLALNEQFAAEQAIVVLDLARAHQYYEFYNKALRKRLQRLVQQSEQLESLSLLDLSGRIVLSSDVNWEGNQCNDQLFFQKGLTHPYTDILFAPPHSATYAPDTDARNSLSCPITSPSQSEPPLIAARPVLDQSGTVFGVIAGRAGFSVLGSIFEDRTGLGVTGKISLADASDTRLLTSGDSSTANKSFRSIDLGVLQSTGITDAIESLGTHSGVYQDYRGTRVLGIYRWLPELGVVLSAEQDLSEAIRVISTTLATNIGAALLAILAAVLASIFIARGITRPLVNLVDTAGQIAAGDLERAAEVTQDDEVGTLALAFNSMTSQLRDLIGNLERRITERTHELQEANRALQQRALQLETSAKVSREVTSILAIDDLLDRVVRLIRDSFGHYHVNIYLLEDEELVLRASSAAYQPQIERTHIGTQSLNTEAVRTNRAVLVNDVCQDPRYLPDEHLLHTRSELVIPLQVGDHVIGTLDVQSKELQAFSAQDMLVIQSLGDQVAIAIENARLYDRSRALAVLEERDRLARELHDSMTQSLYSQVLFAGAGRKMAKAGDFVSTVRHLIRIEESAQQALKEMRLLIHELRPPMLEQEGLIGALGQRLDSVERRAGIKANLLVEGDMDLPAPLEEAFYRVAQEALNNALKHSRAKSVTVKLHAEDSQMTLEVVDDGIGFDIDALDESRGLGLTSMRERAQAFGGSVTITSAPGEGTCVRFSAAMGT